LPVPEGQITEADLERVKHAFELYNQGDYDALRDFIAPDVVMERVGDLPPIHGWDAFRRLQDPDAFEWQRVEPVEYTVNGDKVLLRVRVRAKGAGSGLELDVERWLVLTMSDGLAVRVLNSTDEQRALEAFRAPA
jgi:ketosteroid isomerase-like protein